MAERRSRSRARGTFLTLISRLKPGINLRNLSEPTVKQGINPAQRAVSHKAAHLSTFNIILRKDTPKISLLFKPGLYGGLSGFERVLSRNNSEKQGE